jgi:hypothetical protein
MEPMRYATKLIAMPVAAVPSSGRNSHQVLKRPRDITDFCRRADQEVDGDEPQGSLRQAAPESL